MVVALLTNLDLNMLVIKMIKKLNYFQKEGIINMLSIHSGNYLDIIKNARNIYVAVNMLNDDIGDIVYVKYLNQI